MKKNFWILLGHGDNDPEAWLVKTKKKTLNLDATVAKVVDPKIRDLYTWELVAIEPELAIDMDKRSKESEDGQA